MDPTDIFRTFYPNAEEYTFFSSAHRTFSRIDHISWVTNQTSVNLRKLKLYLFSNHNTMRLDSNYRGRNKAIQTHGD